MKSITKFYLKTLYSSTKGSLTTPKFEDEIMKIFFKKNGKDLYLNYFSTIDEETKVHTTTLQTNKADKVNQRLLSDHYRYNKHDMRDFVKNKMDVIIVKEAQDEQW